MSISHVIFGFLILIIVHSYLIYPLLIKIVSLFFKKNSFSSTTSFKVSILISVYNEEKVILNRIHNLASLLYDFNNIEVLIGSDCSSDKTNEILEELVKKYNWLKIYFFNERRGKALVLNDLAEKANNEILIFTDANSEFKNDALLKLLRNFADNNVGGVSGKLVLKEPQQFNKGIEEKKYWEYETSIKTSEGRCGILIGANGGIFAIKKNLFCKLPINKAVTDDLYLSLVILEKGFKFLYDSTAVAIEDVGLEIKHEFNRKIRFSATNFQTIGYFHSLLFNKNILLSFAFWSHKIIRWLTPVFLVTLFIYNIVIFNESLFFQYFFYAQIIFYSLAIIGLLLLKINISFSIFSLPFYFSLSNIAIIIGLIKFIFRKHTAYWDSTPR